LLWLYPAAWRGRYGRELETLVADIDTRPGDVLDLVWGAIRMQLSTPGAYLKLGAITAAIGALVAGGASFAMPERYVSTAVVRVTPRIPSGATADQARIMAGDRLQQLQQWAFSRSSLAEMIQRPELDLYAADRQRLPLEEIVHNMRTRDVRVRAVNPSTISISFAYGDGKVARRVVNSIVAKFNEVNVATPVRGLAAPVQLEVLDPASLPERSGGPNRIAIPVIGLAAGFALGLLIAWLRRPARSNSAPYLKWALAGALCAGILAGLASFRLPDHYLSTAILRLVRVDAAGLPGLDTADAVREFVQNKGVEALTRTSLAELIQSLDLYPQDRQRRPLEDIITDMRRNIRIQQLPVSPAAFAVSFDYTDRYKAQAVVRSTITKFMEANVAEQRKRATSPGQPGGTVLEVLDPASFPAVPSSPNRGQIAVFGSVVGILLGLVVAFARRRPPERPAATNGYNTAQTSC
jgi:LPS O-antigen subunit length determinant protein (WzzB/FepE family)